MQLIITGKNVNVSDKMETYVRTKMARLDRHLSDPVEARIEFSRENTRSADQRQIVQVTLFNNGSIIRAEERAAETRAAVDAVVDKLDNQVRRYKDKQVRRRRLPAEKENQLEMEPEAETRIVRFKRFRTQPMSEDAAIEQMELLGHSFFLFLNERTGNLNLVYRRQDGDYGLLEPETE